MTHIIADFRATCRTIFADPWAWVSFQAFTLSKAVLPHQQNNDFRKLTTTVFIGAWLALTFGIGPGVTNTQYTAVTAIVCLIVGQQWEMEKFRFGPLEIDTSDSDD